MPDNRIDATLSQADLAAVQAIREKLPSLDLELFSRQTRLQASDLQFFSRLPRLRMKVR